MQKIIKSSYPIYNFAQSIAQRSENEGLQFFMNLKSIKINIFSQLILLLAWLKFDAFMFTFANKEAGKNIFKVHKNTFL